MTELQYEFLCRYRDSGCPNPDSLTPSDRGFFKSCRAAKYIEHVTPLSGTWFYRISDIGEAAMLEHENMLKHEAEERAHHKAEQSAQEQATQNRWSKDARRSWFQFWLNLLFSIIGFAAGVFVEHYFTVLEVLLALF